MHIQQSHTLNAVICPYPYLDGGLRRVDAQQAEDGRELCLRDDPVAELPKERNLKPAIHQHRQKALHITNFSMSSSVRLLRFMDISNWIGLWTICKIILFLRTKQRLHHNIFAATMSGYSRRHIALISADVPLQERHWRCSA